MNSPSNFKLLMLYQSQNDAESVISLFRNQGYATRAKKLNCEADLHQAIEEQSWDLLISDNKHPELSIEQALSIINTDERSLKIPSLLILPDHSSDQELEQAFTVGASDIIHDTNQQHLLHSALREIRHHREQLQHLTMLDELAETKERYELLLEGSKDAIAYITDGMHIHVNEAYAQLFGYQGSDEFDYLPVIDLISDPSQNLFKAFLKRYRNDDGEHRLTLQALREDRSEFAVCMLFSSATYEGENCTQILIRAAAPSPITATALLEDSQAEAQSAIIAAQELARSTQNDSSVALILLDIEEIQATAGYHNCQALLKQFDHYCRQQQLSPLRHGDYGFFFCAEAAPQKLQNQLNKLLADTSEHLFEEAGNSFTLHGHGGLCSIVQEPEVSAQSIIDHCFNSAYEAKKNNQRSLIHSPPPLEADVASNDLDFNHFIQSGDIEIRYQPIVSLRGDTGEYYETSYQLNENFDQCGLRFLQGGESKLDRWIIMEASKALCALRSRKHTDTRLFINLSAAALKDSELSDWLAIILKAANIPAESLIFQISESVAEAAITASQHLRQGLSQHQLRLSISQFSNSGNILKHIKVDFVRLGDEVSEQLNDEAERQKLKELVRTLSGNDVGTIVPQVNIASMLTTLWQIGVGYIQGDYLQASDDEMNYEFTDLA